MSKSKRLRFEIAMRSGREFYIRHVCVEHIDGAGRVFSDKHSPDNYPPTGKVFGALSTAYRFVMERHIECGVHEYDVEIVVCDIR